VFILTSLFAETISTLLSSLLLLPWKESCKLLGFVTELSGVGFGELYLVSGIVCLFVFVNLYVVVVVWFLF
jgi:hypothetical protein